MPGSHGPQRAEDALREGWPPIERWDRAANVLRALEAELEASLLELMDAGAPQ